MDSLQFIACTDLNKSLINLGYFQRLILRYAPRQRYPLSPFLFNLALELFLCAIRNSELIVTLREVKVTFLLYADGTFHEPAKVFHS